MSRGDRSVARRASCERPMPVTMREWYHEICEAMADARGAIPFGPVAGVEINESKLFHLAPVVCLKFRGYGARSRRRKKITVAALASYVANSERRNLEPLLAFAVCYIGAHFALNLISDDNANRVLNHCEKYGGKTQGRSNRG